jgi:hypothetical protein
MACHTNGEIGLNRDKSPPGPRESRDRLLGGEGLRGKLGGRGSGGLCLSELAVWWKCSRGKVPTTNHDDRRRRDPV